MTAIAPTAATPMPPRPQVVQEPRPDTVGGAGTAPSGLRHRITSWMETKLGRAAMPVAAAAGGALGGTIGMLTLGPVGAAIGGIGGAFFGAALFLAG